MKRVISVLASSLLLCAASASTAQVPVRLPEVRVVAPAQGNGYSAWSLRCEFTGHNSRPESVTLRVWDDGFRNRLSRAFGINWLHKSPLQIPSIKVCSEMINGS